MVVIVGVAKFDEMSSWFSRFGWSCAVERESRGEGTRRLHDGK